MAENKKQALVADGLANIITGLGVLNKDKRTGARYQEKFLRREDVDPIYQCNDVAARIVDRVPEEMTREGFQTFADSEEITDQIQIIFEDMGLDKKIEEGLKWARLYGGAGLIMGVQDGQESDQPVAVDSIKSLEYTTILDRYRLMPNGAADIDGDVKSRNFGNPIQYTLQNLHYGGVNKPTDQIAQKPIHFTRVVRFEGVPVSWQQEPFVDWWGDSILSRGINAITNYSLAHDSAALIVQDFTQLLVKLKNLSDMIASGKEDLVQKRLQLVAFSASIINALVVEDGEEIERKTTNVAGLPDLLKMINARLVASTDLPHTVLLGESAGGLGSTGDSERGDFFGHIKNQQESILRPIIKQILWYIFAAKDGPTNGKVPKEFTIEFNPLFQMSQKDQVEIHKNQSEADANYLDRGVLDADEVAESRFGSGQFSINTTLDEKTRKAINSTSSTEEA